VATGEKHLNGVEDVAFITFTSQGIIAHINVIGSLLSRYATLTGEKKMLMWNDLEADEKNQGV